MKRVLLILQLFQKRLIWIIPVFMSCGIICGNLVNPAALRVLIIPFTFLMVYPMMVTLRISKVFSGGGVKVQILTQAVNFLIIPFIAFGMGRIFFPNNPFIALGLLLASLLPTSGMTISWTGFAKGNMNAAIQMTVLGLIFGSIATPIYIKFLMGTVVDVPMTAIFKQILFIVFFPMVAGHFTQKFLIKKYGNEKYKKEIKPEVSALSTVGVLGIVFVAMALKAKTIVNDPMVLLSLLGPIILFYAINFFISTVIARLFLTREDGIAFLYGTVMRNLSIALAIAMTAFGKEGSEIALIIALAYIVQVQSAAWYVKFSDRIFGDIREEVQFV